MSMTLFMIIMFASYATLSAGQVILYMLAGVKLGKAILFVLLSSLMFMLGLLFPSWLVITIPLINDANLFGVEIRSIIAPITIPVLIICVFGVRFWKRREKLYLLPLYVLFSILSFCLILLTFRPLLMLFLGVLALLFSAILL